MPIRTVSEANMTGEHWTKKSMRHKNQRLAVSLLLKNRLFDVKMPCKITFIRIAPRSLDTDNLQSAFKTIRDCVSEIITGETKKGRADNDERLHFEYKQEKGITKEYAIRIEIQNIVC